MQNANSVKGSDILNFDYFATSTVSTSTTSEISNIVNIDWSFYWNIVSISLIFTSIGFILYKLYRKYTSKNSKLMLEISNGSTCVLVPIMDLNNCPNLWYLSKKVKPTLDITGCVVHKLSIDWDSLYLINVNGLNVTMPAEVNVNIYQALKIRKMFNSSFFAHPIIMHNNMVYIPTMQNDESENEKICKEVVVNIRENKLYPSLS